MQQLNMKLGIALVALLLLGSCSDPANDSSQSAVNANLEDGLASGESTRWYDADQAVLGREVFTQNCAICHGPEAQGLGGDWRERLDDGSFPPPPLNGSAHAWHHPQEILLRVIDYGGEAMGGKMPAFIDVLEQPEKLAAIAYFQSFWTDEIYGQWVQMGGTN